MGWFCLVRNFFLAWVGDGFITSYYIAIILIIPLCIPLIQNLGISIMQAKNMHKFRSIMLFLIAIANIAMSIPLAKLYQGIGSAIGTSVSLIIGNIIVINIYYYKKVGIDVIRFWKNIVKMSIPFTLPIFVILIMMKFISLYGYMHVIVFGCIYTLLFLIVSYFCVMNEYEKRLIYKIINKVERRNLNAKR